MKKLIFVLSLALMSVAVSAQNNTGFFLGAGAGFNFGFDGLKFENRIQSHNGSGFAGDFYAGGWLNKTIGLRGGYQGFNISDTYSVFGNTKYNYIHADALFRIAPNLVPYVHGGWQSAISSSIGGGAGLLVPIRITNHLSLIPDLRATMSPNKVYGIAQPGLAVTLSATMGLSVNFGGKSGKAAKSEIEDLSVPVMSQNIPVTSVEPAENVVEQPEKKDADEQAGDANEQAGAVSVQVVEEQKPVEPEVKPDAEASMRCVVYFNTDSSALRSEALPELDKFADFLKANPATKAEIAGYTDSTASDAYNLKLSERRANSVYNYLINKNIDASRLNCTAFGSSNPVGSNATPEGRQENRRVEVNAE